MEQSFLQQEAKRGSQKIRKLYLIMAVIFAIPTAGLGYVIAGVPDGLSDPRTRKIAIGLFALTCLMLVCVALGLVFSARAAADASKSLSLPFRERTREQAAEIIDREIAEGKTQVDEYVEKTSPGKTPQGARVLLLPSYLLHCNGMGHTLAIPRDKIYWVCSQVGRRGQSSFIVRLLIFTELKTFYVEGTDTGHVGEIADKLYQYIPNVFGRYDPLALPYELDALFSKNRAEFVRLYECEKEKQIYQDKE